MKKKTAKKSAPKKSAAKKTTKKTTTKVAAKKTSTKKTAANKTTTKAAAKKQSKSTAAKKTTTTKKPTTKTTQASKKSTNAKPSAAQQSGLVTVNLKFHPDKNGGHHHIVVEDLGNKHVSVGITTEQKYDKKHNNVKLEHSPLQNGETSYARRKGTVDKKTNYHSPKQGEITKTDNEKVKKIADKAKAKATKKS